MRLTLLAVSILLLLAATDAWKKGPREKRPPKGKPLNELAVKTSVHKGPMQHDKYGNVYIPHGKHKKPKPDELPQQQLTIYHMRECTHAELNPAFSAKHGCDYSIDGRWRTDVEEPIVFVVNPTGSGLTADEVIYVFGSAMKVIRDAVPAFKRHVLFEHLHHGHEMCPSMHHSERGKKGHENKLVHDANADLPEDKKKPLPHVLPKYVANGVNEIGFAPRAAYHHEDTIAAEVYALRDRDTKVTIEVDIVLATDSGMSWHHYHGRTGESIAHTTSPHFDAMSTAIWALGHAMGLGPTDAYKATMHGAVARGAFNKRSLECGDVNGLIAIYGR